ncbi:hypothetical protein LTR66_011815 [Elasticomyces elasticus]|nr:hypothetical protein LTR66_011815 [Elasticomyces elasticus]
MADHRDSQCNGEEMALTQGRSSTTRASRGEEVVFPGRNNIRAREHGDAEFAAGSRVPPTDHGQAARASLRHLRAYLACPELLRIRKRCRAEYSKDLEGTQEQIAEEGSLTTLEEGEGNPYADNIKAIRQSSPKLAELDKIIRDRKICKSTNRPKKLVVFSDQPEIFLCTALHLKLNRAGGIRPSRVALIHSGVSMEEGIRSSEISKRKGLRCATTTTATMITSFAHLVLVTKIL